MTMTKQSKGPALADRCAPLTAVLFVLAAACGGKPSGSTTPTPAPEPTPADQGELVSPDLVDEIGRILARKGNAVARCLTSAIENKDVPKNARGRVTLQLTIGRDGKASEVSVLKATLDSKPVSDCAVERVKEIQFPELPSPYTTTYSYAFEAT
jgi:hypothetical protein